VTLAYLFWHRAQPDALGYRAALLDFHAALAAEPPAGFVRSWVQPAPTPGWWLDVSVVADWSALGTLNAEAVAGSRRASHDVVARLAAEGTGGVYALLSGRAQAPTAGERWLAKPAGVPYPAWHAQLTAGAVWQRQLTLGPGAEYWLVDPD